MKKRVFEILKELREDKKLLIREVSSATAIDQGILCKIEKGDRVPTKKQIISLINYYNADYEVLMIAWLSEKVLYLVEGEDFNVAALQVAEEAVKYLNASKTDISNQFEDTVKNIDDLKNELQELRNNDSFRIIEALDLEYTYSSNQIEGNTLTLKETDLVINEGLTISGKTMREHLEAINHHEAILFIKDLVQNKIALNERTLLEIHGMILRNIDRDNAGRYRRVQVYIKGSKHLPPQPYLVPKQMEDFFIWYETSKSKIHPIVLAAEMHERLVSIHPFIDGNGRTARLIMNLILLMNGFVIANIKGDAESRLYYYNSLEKAQVDGEKVDFITFILNVEKSSLEHYINILKS